MKSVRHGHGDSTHGAGRASRVDATRFPWLLGLAVLVLFGAARDAHADHAPDHRQPAAIGATATVPTASRERTLRVAQATGGAGEAATPAPKGLAQTSPALSRLLGLGDGITIGDSNEDEFLDPDVAFVLSAAAAGPDAIGARWDIAEGYYLYRNKFRFRAAEGSGASLGEAGFPEGKLKDDEYFGPMEVYYDSVAALVPVARAGVGAGSGDEIDVDITYQGCAEAGLCYPPITKTVSLLLPAALADTGAGPGGGESTLSDAGRSNEAPAQPRFQARGSIDGDAPIALGLRGSGRRG